MLPSTSLEYTKNLESSFQLGIGMFLRRFQKSEARMFFQQLPTSPILDPLVRGLEIDANSEVRRMPGPEQHQFGFTL